MRSWSRPYKRLSGRAATACPQVTAQRELQRFLFTTSQLVIVLAKPLQNLVILLLVFRLLC